MKTSTSVSAYLARIGRKGGSRSRRHLSAEQAQDMVRVRETRRAFRKFHAPCFWYMRKDMPITLADVPAIVRGLRQNGGRQGFLLAAKLARGSWDCTGIGGVIAARRDRLPVPSP